MCSSGMVKEKVIETVPHAVLFCNFNLFILIHVESDVLNFICIGFLCLLKCFVLKIQPTKVLNVLG